MKTPNSSLFRNARGVARAAIAALATGHLLASAAGAASLSGKVADTQGNPIPNAAVAATPNAGGAEASASTDGRGRFSIADLASGSYQVTIAAPGFRPVTLTTTLDDGDRRLDAELLRITIEAGITVTSSLPDFVSGLEVERRAIEEQGKADLAQALRYEAGMSGTRRGPVNIEPSVRGLQETQVAMFVDGTRTFAAGPARMDSDLSHLSQHAVQDVQIVKGPYALTWGAGTMSAMRLETWKPPFSQSGADFGGRFFGAYSDNNAASDLFADVWTSTEKLRFNVSHNDRRGKDYEGGNDELVQADFESADTRWSLDFQPGASSLVEYSGGYQKQNDIDYQGRLLDATYFKTRSHNLEYQWAEGSGPLVSIYAQAFSNSKSHLMNNDNKPTATDMPGRIPPFGIAVALPTESDTTGGRFNADLEVGNLENKAGADYVRSEQSASRTISRRSNGLVLFEDIVWPDATIDDLGLFWQSVYRGKALEVGGTVRVDFVDARAGEVSDFFRQNTTGSLDQSEENLSAAVSFAHRLAEGWLLNGGIGRTVRTARTLERYSDRFPATKFQLPAEFMGSPEIDPEQALELNLGTRFQSASASFGADLFYRRIDDYITIQPDPDLPRRLPSSPPVVYRYVNGTEATFWGGELRFEHLATDILTWRAKVDYVRGQDELFDEPALGMQPLQGTLGLRLHTRNRARWIDVSAEISDAQDRVAAVRFERPTPGYTIYHLRAGVSLDLGLDITLGVENLTDKAYSHHLNSPNPFAGGQRIPEIGRNVQFALAYRF